MPIAGPRKGEGQVPKLRMERRLPLLAIVKGLTDGNEVSELANSAIAARLHAATTISCEMGQSEAISGPSRLAECAEVGRVE
jgi:hypothetical protein